MIHSMIDYHARYVEVLKAKLEPNLELGVIPSLWILTDGEHPECDSYMRSKLKWATEVGIEVIVKVVKTVEALANILDEADWESIPVILQLPCKEEFVSYYNTRKPATDVDGFFTFQEVAEGDYSIVPATPKGVMRFLKHGLGLGLTLRGKSVVVVGRGMLVGYPLTMMLMNEGATVTTINTKTDTELRKAVLKHADVVILATGFKGSVKSDELKEGAYAINVGTVFDENKKLTTELEVCSDNVTYTDRIGAIGVSTVLSLLDNVLNFYEKRRDYFVWKD